MTKKNIKPFSGTHIFGELIDAENNHLKTLKKIERLVSKIISKNGLCELGKVSHKFKGSGYTIIICLAESHLAIHTWPEKKFVTLDVYACDYSKRNRESAIAVFTQVTQLFQPRKIVRRIISR